MQTSSVVQKLDSHLAPNAFQNAANICETIVLMRSLIAKRKLTSLSLAILI